MKPEQLKSIRAEYHRKAEALEQMVADAMCETFKEITGKEPSDRTRERVYDAIRFSC